MFEGFSPETIDFLWGVRMNNNREWFAQNKSQYVTKLYEPMKALGKDLFVPFLDRPGNILKVSRIYRDARLHHPDPYKEPGGAKIPACILRSARRASATAFSCGILRCLPWRISAGRSRPIPRNFWS